MANAVWRGLAYPGEYPEVARSTALVALAETRRVRQAVMERLPPYLTSDAESRSTDAE
jgi:hypothetical protein